MPGNAEFGKRIQELRKKKMETDPSYSLRQFAAKVGISPTFVSKIENGEFDLPSAENIEKMAALLDCNADELLALAGKVDSLRGVVSSSGGFGKTLCNEFGERLPMTPAVPKTPADGALEYAESIINTVREPLIALDQDLRVVTASRSFYEVFKVKPQETVGHLIYDLGNKQWDIPNLRELLENILPKKATFDDYEVEHDFSIIGRRTMLLNARQIQRIFGKERIILLAIEDITERKKLMEQKDEFIRIASHDLKNPITCITGFASIIDSQIPPGTTMTAETHGYAEKITVHCRFMQMVIEDFLDFHALEDGQIKLTLEAVDLNELARDVLERNASYAAQKQITPHLDLERGSLLVNTDKSRLNQVLENFVSNAIKFSPQGEKVTVGTRKTESGILLEVRDSGPGLTDEDMEKLFVKYAKLSNMPTGGEKSSGLGLAICKKVIEIMGGKTGARNNPGGGATFWFELPGNS